MSKSIKTDTIHEKKKETKKHIKTARIGIKGEAYFEYLMSDKAIVHKISTNKDTGVDFLCHWLEDDMPTRKMFAVQVKTRSSLKVQETDKISGYNSLPEYSIDNKHVSISKADVSFWQLFNIPVFLFVLDFRDDTVNACYYKRISPSITRLQSEPTEDIIKAIHSEPYYKIDSGTLHSNSNPNFGFYRDLEVDTIRCMYNIGAIYIKRNQAKILYLDLLNEYPEQLRETVKSLIGIRNELINDKSARTLYPNLVKIFVVDIDCNS